MLGVYDSRDKLVVGRFLLHICVSLFLITRPVSALLSGDG